MIRPIEQKDFDSWKQLWHEYLQFYRAELPDHITSATFERLANERDGLVGLVAENHDSGLVGFAHVARLHAYSSRAGRPWSVRTIFDLGSVNMSEQTPPWPKQGPASYFPSIEKKYGRSIREWQDIIAGCGLDKHMEIVNYLKSEHQMGHGHANALVGWTLAGNVAKR